MPDAPPLRSLPLLKNGLSVELWSHSLVQTGLELMALLRQSPSAEMAGLCPHPWWICLPFVTAPTHWDLLSLLHSLGWCVAVHACLPPVSVSMKQTGTGI